jgi:hypothetical protein
MDAIKFLAARRTADGCTAALWRRGCVAVFVFLAPHAVPRTRRRCGCCRCRSRATACAAVCVEQVLCDLDVNERFLSTHAALAVEVTRGVEYVVAEVGDPEALHVWLGEQRDVSLAVMVDIFASVMEGVSALHRLNLVAGDVTTATVVGCSRTTGGVVWRPDARHAQPCPPDGGADRRAADVHAAGILIATLVLQHVAIAGYPRVEPETATPEQRADVVRRACRRVVTVSRALASCLRRCCAEVPKWRPGSATVLQLLRTARHALTARSDPSPHIGAYFNLMFSANIAPVSVARAVIVQVSVA